MTQISSPFLLVYISCGSLENARQLASSLVEENLAACVSIVPKVESVYRWQGQVESAEESLLLVKTRAEAFAALRDRVCILHHYELPEIVAVPIVAGLEPYLTWIKESVKPHA